MSKFPPPKVVSFVFLAVLLAALSTGCSHEKTKRGHLFRGDWAFEYNRTPWIGCPAGSGCDDGDDEEGESRSFFDCLKKDSDGKKRKGFRRYCAMNSDCTPQKPCCRTLGCGMWVDPADPAPITTLGGAAKACGLTPFCSPNKPCRMTPNCGKPVNININPQSLLLPAGQNPTVALGGFSGSNVALSGMLPTGRGMNSITPNGGIMADGVVGTTQTGTLVSRGIVPGASAVTSGGMVAAIGVATPAGTMTPIGVRLPNGVVNNNVVLRACMMSPNCTAAHPCGLTPNCGGAVAVNMIANNAVALASALQAQGVAGGVMQAGGMGMLVNPMTNQPLNGITMSGYPQAGYPPIGYAPTGYAPGYPRYAAGMIEVGEAAQEVETEEAIVPETRSAMPMPRFHPIPSKPTFQRSEGMMPTPTSQRTIAKPTTVSMAESRDVSEKELEAALDQAYLEGVSAAMDEVERKLEAKRQAAAKAKLQEKILQQAENFQQQLDAQDERRMLAIQRERQLRLQAEQVQPEIRATEEVVSEARRLSPPKQIAVHASPKATAAAKTQPSQVPMLANKTSNTLNVRPVQLAENLKASLASGVNDVLAPLLGSSQKGTHPSKPPNATQTTTPKMDVATQPRLPDRPPVSPVAPDYGLLPDDEPGPLILQAQFSADEVPIRP